MRYLILFITLAALSGPAHAQFLLPWRQACYEQRLAAQNEVNSLRYQMLADQQRQQFELLRLQMQQQPTAGGGTPNVSQEVLIYLVQPAQPPQVVQPQVVPQIIQQPQPPPQTIPIPQIVEKPSTPIILQGPSQPAPQIIALPGGAPQQQLPGGAPQQSLPGGAPQQTLPGGAPIQILPGGGPIQILPGGSAAPKTVPDAVVTPPVIVPPVVVPKQTLPGGAPNPSSLPRGYQSYTKWRPVTSRPLHH